ncbi:hypothetical protein A2W14_07530 [Candidatus Gottesmanbacteria bacterium RBG_16_37_8]|uniref:DNA-directed DNA polymerase n=1 Tax=Candidatus Gottesmanbacteria bacterium RBG_16_37_8 TaxID=1798371 RepID=A0A1F5YTA3_9BACT|nr:MAG: hypothetical protein A2W14_07530 [Candidatus Gottesmanbacteria bacterium RBG_16_37_8]
MKLRQILETSKEEKIYLDGRKISFNELLLACESNSIVAVGKIIILENFFQAKESKDKIKILDYLINPKLPISLIFWENKEIDKKKIGLLPAKTEIHKFDFEGYIFKFLDGLGSQPSSQILNHFHSLLKSSEPELIFGLIIRQFRYMIASNAEQKNILGIPDWQFFKFKRQAKNFDYHKLIFLYRQLLQLDYKIKTGQSPQRLDQLLDIFLVNL